jgi:uncharacterized membrane-anchored protein YhcB (DUF1043 family)
MLNKVLSLSIAFMAGCVIGGVVYNQIRYYLLKKKMQKTMDTALTRISEHLDQKIKEMKARISEAAQGEDQHEVYKQS